MLLENVEYSRIADIDFTSAKGKKWKLDEMINCVNNKWSIPKLAV